MLNLMTKAIALKTSIEMSAQERFFELSKNQEGATAVEYALIVGLIAVAIIAAVTLLGGSITTLFNHAACVVKGGTWSGTACS